MSADLVSGIEERMWTEKEVARLLHIGVKTLWAWRRDKLVTFVRLPGGSIRYRRQDIEELLGTGLCLSNKIKCSTSTKDETVMKRGANNGYL
jgi:predicted site-specific integrase-resolvase